MRPFSFTKNLGGLEKAYHAIRKGYRPGVSIDEFSANCGLGSSLVITEFLLGTRLQSNEECVLDDALIVQTLLTPQAITEAAQNTGNARFS
jgi:hypothetical protein